MKPITGLSDTRAYTTIQPNYVLLIHWFRVRIPGESPPQNTYEINGSGATALGAIVRHISEYAQKCATQLPVRHFCVHVWSIGRSPPDRCIRHKNASSHTITL